jgi:regulator of protease activity HflC (stomatin/prohibitin superfamily)
MMMDMMDGVSFPLLIFAIVVIIFLFTGIKVVPQRSVYVVERLGKYSRILDAGMHFMIPFVDRIAYKHSTKETAIDVPSQTCITRDNIAVAVDGILYMQVIDPVRASYGISNYLFAATQLAQTTMRSVIGKLDLDVTFLERSGINKAVVEAVDTASDPWGVKVTRYEIKNISPPDSISEAMEKQMRAEREKRAQILESEGDKQSRINKAEGERQALIAYSEGEKQRRINEAEGKAREIELVAKATADSLIMVGAAIKDGGYQAVSLRVAEQYVQEFGKLAKTNNTMIIPAELSNLTSALGLAAQMFKTDK